jgi:hypothetical protein
MGHSAAALLSHYGHLIADLPGGPGLPNENAINTARGAAGLGMQGKTRLYPEVITSLLIGTILRVMDDRIGHLSSKGLELAPEALEKLIEFGEGRPYPTMTAARYAALGARKLGSVTVDAFDAQMAIDEARRHLAEDDHA